MGLLQYLQRSIASLLRPWLLHQDVLTPLLLHLRFSQLVLELPFLEFDCSAINSSLFASSAFLLRNARLDRATLTISFFRSPGVFLELRGLRLVGNPRRGEDDFWAARRKRSADENKRESVSALDPQGAAVHAAAERLAKGEASRSLYGLFWVSLALRAIRIELVDVAIELHSNTVNRRSHRCALYSQLSTLEEGFRDGAWRTAGLFGALIVGLVDALRRADRPCYKFCVVQNFCVHLTPAPRKLLPTSSGAEYLSQPLHDSSHLRAGTDSVNERVSDRDVSNKKSGCALLWKAVLLTTTFCETQFYGMNTDVMETALQLNLADVEALLSIVSQLQGAPGNAIADYASYQESSKEASGRTTRRGRYLWDKAVGRLIGGSWRRKLKYAVEARVLRQRYARLYASWLRETGWGGCSELSESSGRKTIQGRKSALKTLESELFLLEQELPVEAIALGRRVARCKVSTSTEGSSITATFTEVRGWDDALCVLKPALDGLKKCLPLIFYCVYELLWKGTKRIVNRMFVGRVRRDESEDTLAKGSGSCYKCRETKSGKEWTSSFHSTFQRGSLVFAGIDLMQPKKADKSAMLSDGTAFPPVAHFTWGNLCLMYQSNDNKMSMELICGYVQGEMLSAFYNPEESADFYNNDQGSMFKGDNMVKFLESGPAPHLAISERAMEFVKHGDFQGTSLLGKNQFIASGVDSPDVDDAISKNCNNGRAKPFLLFELESSQADTRVLEISSGMVKCGLALGRLDCNFDASSFTNIAVLLMQFLEIPSVDKHSSKVEAYGYTIDTSAGSSKQCKDNEWLASYAGWMKQVISAVVFKKKLWLTAAIESPKIQFSLDSQGTVGCKKRLPSGVHRGEKFMLVLFLGLLEATVWPAQAEQNSTPADKVDKEFSSRKVGYDVKETKKWLRKPPSARLYGESMFETYSEQGQIGNNVILSMHEAALTLQVPWDEMQSFPLIGPLKMTWECSLCRHNIISIFHLTEIVSFAAVGLCSGISVNLYLDELDMLFEAGKVFLKASRQVSLSNDCHRLSHKSPKSISTEPDEDLLDVQGGGISVASESKSVGTFFTSEPHPSLYFAVSAEVQIEDIDFHLGFKRKDTSLRAREEKAVLGNIDKDASGNFKEVQEAIPVDNINLRDSKLSHNLDMIQKIVWIPCKDLCLQLSWGDGYQLYMSARCREGMFVIKDGSQIDNNKCTNSFKTSKIQKVKGTSVESTNSETVAAQVLCELRIEQLSFWLQGPLLSSDAHGTCMRKYSIVEGTHLSNPPVSRIKSVEGQNKVQPTLRKDESMPEAEACWLTADLEISKLQLTDCTLDRVVNMASLRSMGSNSFCIHVSVTEEFKCISIISKGGMFVLHAQALSVLMQQLQYLFVSMKAISIEKLRRDSILTSMADSSISAPKLGKSSSLPLQNADIRIRKQGRLYSAPIRSFMDDEATNLRGFPWLPGGLSVEVGGLCMLLAQTNALPGDKGGLLFEVDVVSKFEGNVKGQTASLEITRLSMCSLQSAGGSQVRSSRQGNQSIPRFGSTSNSSAGLGGSEALRPFEDVSTPMREVSPFCNSVKNQLSLESKNLELVSSSDSGGVGTGRVNDYILENLRISCRVENTFSKGDFNPLPGSDGWKGTCSFMGIDIAITTLEIQLLLALLSCFAGIAAIYDHPKSLKSFSTPRARGLQQMYDHGGFIPDGSIVAVKDAREHLYMAVEKVDGQYRLVGVLHYSLVGDRALFKVKYQKPGRNSSQSWFSLISVSAKNAHDEHFRVHFRPGSGLADIASTHDGSWELWQTISYTHSTKEDDGDIDIYGGLYNNLVYLLNQKSKQGVSLASGAPMMVKKPGNPFKFKILGLASAMEGTVPERDLQIWRKDAELAEELPSTSSVAIPKVDFKLGKIMLTLLHETGGKHLLPLLRCRLEDSQPVIHVQSCKIRVMGGWKIILEYVEPHGNQWSMIMQPVDTQIFYRLRRAAKEPIENQHTKMLTSLFARFKKVDIVISETSLDVMLFMIGALDLAAPYTMRHSPVLANSCLVENHTGLSLCCSFDNGTHKEVSKVAAWTTDSFLVRNMTSRRDLLPTKVSSSVVLYLEKTGCGSSSPIYVSLVESGITAVRTYLENEQGRKKVSGPVVVVDVLKQSQDGITVSASPMVRIHNASGLPLELRCRRPNHDGEGAVVSLEDGDVIDNSMGAFDSMKLQGELRKALSSFNLGNYLLSVRPAQMSLPVSSSGSHAKKLEQSVFEWSDDIEGEKARHVSGFFEKLQYGLRKSLKQRSLSYSFSTVHCRLRKKESNEGKVPVDVDGVHLCIRCTGRQVPVTSVNPQDKPQASRSTVAWQKQQELVILPTIRVYNLLQLNISITSVAFPGDKGNRTYDNEVHIEKGGKAFMYAELAKLLFTVKIEDSCLTSKPVNIGDWKKNYQDITTAPDDGLKELEMELDFGDNVHFGQLKIFRGDDGVLQILVYTQYAFKNDSDTALLCCAQKRRRSRWGARVPWNEGSKMQWPPGEAGICIDPGSEISWLYRSCHLVLQLAEKKSEATGLDIESFSGSTVLSLAVHDENSVTEQVHLGVTVDLPSAGNLDPTHVIHFISRFRVLNDSQEAVFVCQDGLQEDENAIVLLNAGEHVAPRTVWFPGQEKIRFGQAHNAGSGVAEDSLFSLRFRIKDNGWDWSGPVCASALGSFSLRICRSPEANKDVRSHAAREKQPDFKFVAINVEEHSSSLIMRFCIQSSDTVPYRIENSLPRASLIYHQKGLSYLERVEPGQAVGYAWDDLSLSHKLVVQIAGTKFCQEINLDKLAPWKSFRASPHNTGFGLQLPFHNQIESNQQYDSDEHIRPNTSGAVNVGYEVCAGGPCRVLRVCEDIHSSKQNMWQSHVSVPSARMDFKVPALAITIVELTKQKNEVLHTQSTEDKIRFSPILCLRMSSMLLEFLNTEKHILLQLKVETLSVDEKWEGAPFAAMLRVHSQDRFKRGETVLHMAAVVSKHATNPNLVKYSSILLQAIDLNLDEETLVKLVPFYRSSLAMSTSSRQMYFERFEIHPIKIVASFIPGQAHADYTSAQETFRTLLHSFIKIPSVRGTTVELNGVLLSHALLTFSQLAIKCAQHYSWYAMRAIYIAKGSKLLPPAFTSLFDDSAASSLDVFFDPSNGSIDLQGLTLGMFNLLSKGLNKQGCVGTSRYIGDLEHMMKTAGSNILFAVMTEVSDNVLKGAETGGFDGMVNGFRRGILNLAMEPSVLRVAVVKGGSSRRIKLDHSAGTDEMYIEGYLQAMLDALFKQDYLKVKVVDDQVLLKNLPPNSMLVDEIIGCVRNFLVGEGLLAGESSTAAIHSLRRLQGEHERRLVPGLVALCEQLFVIFAVRGLRNQAKSWFYGGFRDRNFNEKTSAHQSDQQTITDARHQSEVGGQQHTRSIKRVLGTFVLSSAMAYLDGRLCRHIPNTLARRIVSGFLLSFVE